MHGSKLGSNLLRRPAIQHEVVTNALEKFTALDDSASTHAALSPKQVALTSQPCSVCGPLLPAQFTRQRGRIALEASGNGSDAGTVADLDLQHGTLFGTQMTVLLSHADTLRDCGALHLEVESKLSRSDQKPGYAICLLQRGSQVGQLA